MRTSSQRELGASSSGRMPLVERRVVAAYPVKERKFNQTDLDLYMFVPMRAIGNGRSLSPGDFTEANVHGLKYIVPFFMKLVEEISACDSYTGYRSEITERIVLNHRGMPVGIEETQLLEYARMHPTAVCGILFHIRFCGDAKRIVPKTASMQREENGLYAASVTEAKVPEAKEAKEVKRAPPLEKTEQVGFITYAAQKIFGQEFHARESHLRDLLGGNKNFWTNLRDAIGAFSKPEDRVFWANQHYPRPDQRYEGKSPFNPCRLFSKENLDRHLGEELYDIKSYQSPYLMRVISGPECAQYENCLLFHCAAPDSDYLSQISSIPVDHFMRKRLDNEALSVNVLSCFNGFPDAMLKDFVDAPEECLTAIQRSRLGELRERLRQAAYADERELLRGGVPTRMYAISNTRLEDLHAEFAEQQAEIERDCVAQAKLDPSAEAGHRQYRLQRMDSFYRTAIMRTVQVLEKGDVPPIHRAMFKCLDEHFKTRQSFFFGVNGAHICMEQPQASGSSSSMSDFIRSLPGASAALAGSASSSASTSSASASVAGSRSPSALYGLDTFAVDLIGLLGSEFHVANTAALGLQILIRFQCIFGDYKMYPNLILSGAPGCGKSAVCEAVRKILPPNSFTPIDHISSQALTGMNGTTLQQAVLFDERPGWLGKDPKQDQVNQFISTLTGVAAGSQYLFINPDTGKRSMMSSEVYARRFMLMCMNGDPCKFLPRSLIDRSTVVLLATSVAQKNSIVEAAAREVASRTDPVRKQRAEEVAKELQFINSLISFVSTLIFLGVFPQPEIGAAVVLHENMKRKLADMGVYLGGVRGQLVPTYFLTMCTVMDATLRAFARFGRDWKHESGSWTDFRHVLPLLVASDRTAAFAITIAEEPTQSKLDNFVLESLIHCVFKDDLEQHFRREGGVHMEEKEDKSMQPVEGKEDKDVVSACISYDATERAADAAPTGRLAGLLHSRQKGRECFRVEDIKATLDAMSQRTVVLPGEDARELPSFDITELKGVEKKRAFAHEISDGKEAKADAHEEDMCILDRIEMPYAILHEKKATASLPLAAIVHACENEFTIPGSMVLGYQRPDRPHDFICENIKRRPEVKVERANPDFRVESAMGDSKDPFCMDLPSASSSSSSASSSRAKYIVCTESPMVTSVRRHLKALSLPSDPDSVARLERVLLNDSTYFKEVQKMIEPPVNVIQAPEAVYQPMHVGESSLIGFQSLETSAHASGGASDYDRYGELLPRGRAYGGHRSAMQFEDALLSFSSAAPASKRARASSSDILSSGLTMPEDSASRIVPPSS